MQTDCEPGPGTTVAALFFAVPPAIDFARLAAELDAALRDVPHERRVVTWDCDDVAIFDLDGSRIVLGWADRLPGALRSCLTVSVGVGPAGAGADRFAARRMQVARLIVGRIAARLPAADIVWHGLDGVMTADRLDATVDAILAAFPPAAGPAPAPGPATADDPAALDRLKARMERELTAARAAEAAAVAGAAPLAPEAPRAAPVLRARRANPTGATGATGALARARARAGAAAAAAIVNDVPDLPRPASDELLRIRTALYPPVEPVVEAAPSTPQRLAVGTVSMTLLIVAAPVGAALLTYNTLKGADLRLTARAAALTGAVLAIAQAPGLAGLLAHL